MRVTGIQRSKEELKKIAEQTNAENYVLRDDQDEFTGTPEELKMMQNFERAYIAGKPIISDEEYEIYKNKLHYKESVVATAPSGRKYVRLTAPLGSLAKVGSMNELEEFLTKDKFPVSVELKLDGLTANCVYKLEDNKYKLEYITTRGNGRSGLILNKYALAGVKTNIPNEINTNGLLDIFNKIDNNITELPKLVEFRGEAVIPKEVVGDKYGEHPVWRNISTGMFNRKQPMNLQGLKQMYDDGALNDKEFNKAVYTLLDKANYQFRTIKELTVNYDDNVVEVIHGSDNKLDEYVVSDEYLDVVFYSVGLNGINYDNVELHKIPELKNIKQIKLNGKPRQNFMMTDNIDDVKRFVSDFYGTDLNGKRDYNRPRLRNMYEYAVDGVVIKPINSNGETQHMWSYIGKNGKIVTPDRPKDQVAIKLQSTIVKVKLNKIIYKTTSINNQTCQGILDKPYLTESGSYVQNINLNNPGWLEERPWIHEGGTYDMVMAMDIIPVLLKPLKEYN